ncbi:MAG: S9 family peptidase [Cytophagales bacterium]|nr:S9 family peptidase [Cytophagales bacterium]
MQEAPKAKKIPKELKKHGHTRVDNYFWLNERENQEVIDYLNEENKYTEKMMSHTKDFQKKLFDEMVGRIKQTDMSVPYQLDGYYYYVRYEEGKEYPLYCRKKGDMNGEEKIMLNVPEMAAEHSFFQVGGKSVSTDNRLLAYSEDTLGRRKYTVKFKNLETGEIYPDEILNTTGGITWANDNKTVFYTKQDEKLRAYKIFKHVLGTDAVKDKEVYHESDETFNTFVYKTKSKKYLVIGSGSTVSTEYQILEADNPNGEFRVFEPRKRDHEYGIAHYGDKFYVQTNDQAKNFRLMVTDENKTGKENWKEVIAHREDVLLEDLDIFKDFLVISERKEGLSQLRILPWKDFSQSYYMEFNDPAYLAYTAYNPEFDTPLLRYGYQSMTTPNSTYDFNMETREQTLLKQQEVLGGKFDPENYTSERLMVKARDGVKVPVSLVYRKGTKLDGNAPLLLYAYGSYGYSMDPYFSSARLSLLDRGFVYAIAHIRGGQEMGRKWYDDGKLLKKKNTFTDFIDCGKHLVKNNYTNSEKLCIMGGSAGGLLMGAVINMEPELFKASVAAVPFVDVVTTMLDESIPLTTGEYDEWGNPNKKEYYDYILSYSPYDNVMTRNYPALLVTSGLHDSQVQYWEPTKWVAKLRDLNPKGYFLLHTNMDAGHGGASGRFESYKETALEYAFLLDQVGWEEPAQ